VLAAAAASPRAIPFDMDEFAAFHALGCAAHPLSAQYNVFREGCGQYGLRPPFLPVALPLRSYLYIGSLPVLPFYPFWRLLDDPVAVRVQGAVFFLVAIVLAGRLALASFPSAALAACVLPVLAGGFLVDTGPVGLSLVLLFAAWLLLRRAAQGERPQALAAAAGFLCFLGVWTKLVFAWCLPGLALCAAAELAGRRADRRNAILSALAFFVALAGPTALLLLSRTADGTPYYEVLSVGRFSLEARSVGGTARGLLGYLWNGSSIAPRSLVFPPSPADRLPLLTAALLVAFGLRHPARRFVAIGSGAALLTFGVTILSGRALAAHHLAFALAFLLPALAAAIRALPRRGAALAAASVLLCWSSLGVRWSGARVDPHSDADKDRLLAWIRESGKDEGAVQLHSSWGTYYIAHLFGAREEIVLFSRKFAREPAYLEAARDLAAAEKRGVLLVSGEPERFRPEVAESVLGRPLAEQRFGHWRVLEYGAGE
jgi:hypothetical protein